jgi:hypothetical protein
MQKLSLTTRRFRTIKTPSALKLPFPVHPLVRLAQLSPVPPFGLQKPFQPQSAIELEGFRPNIIAGTSSELLQLAEQVELGTLRLASVDQAVVALTRCGHAPVSDVARVVLWQAFGVPVYEIFTGHDNSILGYECELHEGWHLASKVRFTELSGELMLEAAGVSGLHTALSGFMTEDPCPCGRSGLRLLKMQPIKRPDSWLQWADIA